MVLANEEYRESVDIDFLVSNRSGYQNLRHEITGKNGLSAIVRKGMKLSTVSPIKADQYGIRTMLEVGGSEIKFEIILEGRIQLEKSSESDRICGIHCLTKLDMAASKLLANSDRWYDDSVFSRDLIDLAMLDIRRVDLIKAFKKAIDAYGPSVERDLAKAIESLSERKDRLENCMEALKMDTVPKALLWQKIKDLKKIKV